MFGSITIIAMFVGLGMGLLVTSDPVEAARWNRIIVTRHPSDGWGYSTTHGCQVWTNQSTARLSGTMTTGFRSVDFQLHPGDFFQHCGEVISFGSGRGGRFHVEAGRLQVTLVPDSK
jgi:hypothetical protein